MPLRHETMSVQLQSDNSNQHPHDTHGPDIHASVIHVGIVCHCQDDCCMSELTPAQKREVMPPLHSGSVISCQQEEKHVEDQESQQEVQHLYNTQTEDKQRKCTTINETTKVCDSTRGSAI